MDKKRDDKQFKELVDRWIEGLRRNPGRLCSTLRAQAARKDLFEHKPDEAALLRLAAERIQHLERAEALRRIEENKQRLAKFKRSPGG